METRKPSKQRLEEQIKEHVKEYLARGKSIAEIKYNTDSDKEQKDQEG